MAQRVEAALVFSGRGARQPAAPDPFQISGHRSHRWQRVLVDRSRVREAEDFVELTEAWRALAPLISASAFKATAISRIGEKWMPSRMNSSVRSPALAWRRRLFVPVRYAAPMALGYWNSGNWSRRKKATSGSAHQKTPRGLPEPNDPAQVRPLEEVEPEVRWLRAEFVPELRNILAETPGAGSPGGGKVRGTRTYSSQARLEGVAVEQLPIELGEYLRELGELVGPLVRARMYLVADEVDYLHGSLR